MCRWFQLFSSFHIQIIGGGMATEVKISSITHNFIFKAFYLRGGLENKISWVAIWQNSNNMKMHRIEQCLLRLTEHLQKTISRREHRYIKAGVSVTSHVSNGTAQLTIHKMKTIIKKKKKMYCHWWWLEKTVLFAPSNGVIVFIASIIFLWK